MIYFAIIKLHRQTIYRSCLTGHLGAVVFRLVFTVRASSVENDVQCSVYIKPNFY